MNTIFGAVINENLTDEIIVTVIATGFDQDTEPLYHSYTKPETPVVTRHEETETDDSDDDDDIIPSFLKKRGF